VVNGTVSAPITPTITPNGTFPTLTTTYGTPSSSSNSVLVSGGSLTSNITATAPSNFQVSADNTNWGSAAIYTNSGGFASGSLFLRLASNALAGTYSNQVVALTSGSASNSVAIATSTVNPYSITVGAVATNKVYGAADPTFTYTSTPLLFSDSLSGSLGRAAGGNVGTYAINQGTLANPNYSISFTGANLTITAAALPAISWNGGTITNSNGVASFSYLYTGRNSNGISTTYSNSLAPTNAGYYTVVATSTDGNYSGTATNPYSIAGPVAVADTLQSPTREMNIDPNNLLANDRRIDIDGTVQTNGLSISAVANGSGTATLVPGDQERSTYIAFNAGASGTKNFTYTLSYGLQTATGTVTVTGMDLQASAPRLSISSSSVSFDPDGGDTGAGITTATVTLMGDPGKMYYIQFCGELNQTWQDAGGWESGTGTFTITVQQDGNQVADWQNSMYFKAQVTNP
jgi:hypothetical protein